MKAAPSHQTSSHSHSLTRRELLKKTFVFSTGLLAAKFLSATGFAAPTGQGIHLLAFGDFGAGKDGQGEGQIAVARQMEAFADKLGAPLTGILGLGDNFYGAFTQDRFRTGFEEMYSKDKLNCPFYNCIGNHDYYNFSENTHRARREGMIAEPRKCDAQLEYARNNPSSRWKMPAKWYSVELPDSTNPLVKVIVLDSNFWEAAMTVQEKIDQRRFLAAELNKTSRAPWLWITSHYPMFTASEGRKSQMGSSHHEWLADAIRSHGVSFYWAGHDHNLQHLEVEGFNTSFVVSGAGGAGLYEVDPAKKGFSQSVLGFNHIYVTPEYVDTQFIDSKGNLLHAFRRTISGEVTTPQGALKVEPAVHS